MSRKQNSIPRKKPVNFLGLIFRGDRSTPILTDYTMLPTTYGGMHTSRIWHTKEATLNFEYRQYNVRKKNVAVMCVCGFFPGVECQAKMTMIPRNPHLIISKRRRFL